MDTDFKNKIVFDDEAHSYVDDVVNPENYRTYDLENPRLILEKPFTMYHRLKRVLSGHVYRPGRLAVAT